VRVLAGQLVAQRQHLVSRGRVHGEHQTGEPRHDAVQCHALQRQRRRGGEADGGGLAGGEPLQRQEREVPRADAQGTLLTKVDFQSSA